MNEREINIISRDFRSGKWKRKKKYQQRKFENPDSNNNGSYMKKEQTI